MNENFYRYEDQLVGDEFSSSVQLVLRHFPVLKRTAKGVWLSVYGKKRFVLLGTHKKFAAATKEEALKSFIARKESQMSIYKARVRRAEEALWKGKAVAEAIAGGADPETALARAFKSVGFDIIDNPLFGLGI